MLTRLQRDKIRELRGLILARHHLTMTELRDQEGWQDHNLKAILFRYIGTPKRPRKGTKLECILLRLEELAGNGGEG